MPDAIASPEDPSQAVDSTDRSRAVESKGRSEEVGSREGSKEVEVACPHCDRPTTVEVSNPGAEIRVRPYLAAFGEHSTARCADGHEFWIYYC